MTTADGSKGLERAGADSRALSIGALSRATRIPVETLRTWERRYGSPKPERKPSGHRLYPASSVAHLRQVARLLARGHRPGEVLRLSAQELDALLSVSDPLGDPAAASTELSAITEPHLELSLRAALQATESLDPEPLMRELHAHWARLGPLRFLEDFAAPLMIRVGRAWKEKTLAIRHEHFASACLSTFLREAREPYDLQARGPRVMGTLLPGDTHEGGLLMACLLLAYRGFRVVYVGADTPIAQIPAAAAAEHIETVALSVSKAMNRRRSTAAIRQLRDLLPRRIPIWVGGAGAPASLEGAECFDSLHALDVRLTA